MPLQSPRPEDVAHRVELTCKVRDTDVIPKVDGAGQVRDIDGRRVQVMHNGLLIDEGCYGGHFETQIIERLQGHHEPQEELAFHVLMERLVSEGHPEDRVIVELGAFWSYYSMWFLKSLPGSTAVMVEPDPNNLEVGRRNLALNGLEGEFIEAAVGFSDGDQIWLQCESDGKARQVATVTLGTLLAERGLERCDLLLCDTQGAELAVLEAAKSTMAAGKVRFLVISTHHQIFSGDALTHQRCLALLEDAGAHIIAEHSISESCSGDGLIVASLDPRDADLHVDVTRVRARDSVFGEPEFAVDAARGWRGPVRHYGGRVYRKAQARLQRAR